ncbi:hypothetical protein ADUPG1_009040, partial [Aduncisulcus paluster]
AAKAKHDTEKARFDAQKAIVDSLEEELKGLTKTTTDLKADVKKNEVELTEITERFSDIEKDKEFHARVTVAIGNHMNRCADAGILKTVNKAIELVDRMKESPDLQSAYISGTHEISDVDRDATLMVARQFAFGLKKDTKDEEEPKEKEEEEGEK